MLAILQAAEDLDIRVLSTSYQERDSNKFQDAAGASAGDALRSGPLITPWKHQALGAVRACPLAY